MEHTKHLWRLGVLLVLLLIAGVVGRHFLIPESFGEMGFYRYDALFEQYEKEPLHGDAVTCGECHDTEHEAVASGAHAVVQCEVCHNTLATHVRDDDKFADMAIDRSFTMCAYCHRALRARPADMTQIDIAAHLAEQADLEPDQPRLDAVCLDCHDPHGP